MKTMFYTLRRNAALCAAAVVLCCAGAAWGQEAQPAGAPAIASPSPARVADTKLAQAWFDASAAQAAKPGHFTALVQVERGGKMVADFRYDRLGFDKFPEIERVVTPDGLAFARNAGKSWVASWNWGKSGAAATAEQSAALDGMVEFALRALQPSADAGAVWKPLKGAPGVFERAAKADAGDDSGAAKFGFSENSREIAGTLLRNVTAAWKWEGAPAKVSVYYFYFPESLPQQNAPLFQQGGPQAQPDSPLPEEQIAEALADARSRPVKVDVVMALNEAAPAPAVKPVRVRVAGIISGKDFDLTVIKDGVASRQIALGNDSWTSRDGGTTWQKQAAANRTYYDAARRNIEADNPGRALKLLWDLTLPPVNGQTAHLRAVPEGFEAVNPPANAAAAQKTDGEKPRRLSLKALDGNMTSDWISYWVEMNAGKPVLRGVTGEYAPTGTKFTNAVHYFAQYGDVAGDRGVLAPPGNPEALPPVRGDDLLAAALKAMDGKMWHADLQIDQQPLGAGGVWGNRSPSGHVEGLISGQDFDLTYENGRDQPARAIEVGGKVWVAGQIAGIWTKEAPGEFGSGKQADARAPLEWWLASQPYDIAGKETHDGETWLHLRYAGAEDLFLSGAVDYWLLLDGAGNPVSVRRCEWSGLSVGLYGNYSGPLTRGFELVDYTPARPGGQIKPPPGE